MYFNFENYESKGGSKEHFLNSFTKNYDLENDTYERVQKGIENFNKENNTSFDLYDYLKFNSKKIKFKKKEPLQEQGKEDLNEDLAEQKEPLQDENLEENKSFKRKHDLSKESEILNDTSLLSDVKNSLKRGAETLSDVVGLDELVNFDSDIKSKADENIKDLIKQGASYEDLNELEKNYLANKESRENVRDATNIFSKEKSIKGLASLYGTNEEEKAKKAFAEMKSTQEALSKEKFEDLNEQEKELIDKERGAVESFFVNLRDDEYKQKSFDELKEKYEAKNFISKDVLRDLEFLKNIHQSKSVSSLILSADEKEKKDYENSVLNIALNAGFDDVLVDEKEGKMYFEKEGQKYLVNEGFFDNFTNTLLANTGSITGGLIGAAKGASSAKSPQSALAKSIAYSALGSGIGASADVLATNYLLDRKNRFDEMLHHALEESALSAVGDALVLGAKPLLKTAKDSIKDFGKILDYTPLVSTTKNFPTQNIKAAQDLVEKSVDLNTQKELDEFYKAYGGRSDLADSKALDALVDTFKAKFGEDSFISKNTQKLNDILNLNSLSAKQNALFEAIRADESGFLLPYIKEVASYDVKAFKNLKNILNLSTAKLESSLKNLNLNKGDIKNILDELEKGTKEDYNEVMNEILAKTYDDRFKVVLDRGDNADFKQALQEQTSKIKSFDELVDIIEKSNKKGRDMQIIGKENLSPRLLSYIQKNNKKVAIDTLSEENAKILGFKYPKNVKRTIDTDAINHILNRHGVAKDGQKAVSLDDISKWHIYSDSADKQVLSKDNLGQDILLSAKQINGHYIVVESIRKKNNELALKTMYYNNGKLENNPVFKEAQTLLRGFEPDANSFAPLENKAERLLSIDNNQAVRSLSPKPSANLDNSHLSTSNNYTKFRKDLQEQGLLDEEAMKFLNYVENTIYNPKGVTFTQLNNALKNINSFYKQSTNPGFKEHIKNAVESFLRDDIKKGINEIFKQDKNLYAKASKLYETSLAEYAQMKELLKASSYKKARNESTTQVKALDELIRYAKGQGKDGLNNLDFLRAKLDEKDVAILEMNLLNRLYEKSLANTDESLRVFDSTSFLNELSTLQNNAFKSKEANDFIELVKGFDKLFKNDAKIALELAPVTAKKEGSALATSAKGAVLQKVVKSGFDLVFRNLGQNVLFGAFKDSIQGAALRYHLKKALQKSDTISEFNTSFKDRLKKGQFNSKTRELSKDFLNDVENFSKNLDEEINFTMQESKEMPTKTEFKIDENLQAKLNLDTDVLKADLQKLKSTHPELFKNKGAVARLINKIKGNPTFFFDNNRLDMKLVGAYIKDNFAELGIVTQGKNTGDIGHILETSKAQQRIKSLQNRETKSPLVETATLDTLPYNKADGRNSDISLSKDKDNSTTNVASLSKTRELSKDFLNDVENFSKNLDEEILKDTKLSDESLKDLPKDLQEQWIKEFNLKSVDEDFVPKLPKEIENIFEGGIHLKLGSLIKLQERDRLEFLKKIKPTLQEPDAVLRQNDGAYIFIKDFKQKKYFSTVTRNENGKWVVTSNAPKTLNNIKNKISEGGELVYNTLPELPIIAKPELPAKALNSEGDVKPNSTTNSIKLQANSHIGTGLASGTVSGLETDENGNIIGFDPQKFALGFLGGSAGSVAVSKGFRFLKDNPQYKEALKKELADTLAKGWENASAKYPLLDLIVKPQYIMQNEKGRLAQAGNVLKQAEKIHLEQSKEAIIKNLDSLETEKIPQSISKEEFLSKGLNEVINKENFLKHLENSEDSFNRLKYLNLVEPTKTRANVEFTQGERKGYIKAFAGDDKRMFYVLITEDKDKILITGIPTSKKREVIRQIKKADYIEVRRMDSIDTLSPTAKASENTENVSTSQADSTTDSALLSKAQTKFKYDEKKAKDLLEWHADSSPFTKDKDGLPKVFYHGSKVKGLEEFKSEFDESGLGFWFNANENRAKAFAKSSSDKLYPVFLYIKKPFDLNQSINTKNVKELSELLGEDLHKYIATDKQSLQKELDKVTNSKDFAVIEGRGLMLESNKKLSEYAYAYNGKWYVNLYNETDLQREGLQKLLPFMQKAQNLNQAKTFTELLNEKEMGEYQKNTHRFLQNLKAKGYDSILPNGKASDDDIIVFDSNQIKHINNKGSYTDSSGNITSTKPKDTEAEHRYFNENSPNIFYSNSHIGTGLASGTVSGLETDENGNIIGFDPQKFALGFLGGSAGSVAVSKGFRFLKDNPQYKKALKKELADTLAKGWENASAKYPLLDLIVKPQYIMQNEKGRIAQANHILNKLEQKEAKGLANVTYNGKNASLVYKDLENIDEAILYAKGTKKKGGAHIRIKHSTQDNQEGYVTPLEVSSLGKNIREFLKYNEPFIDSNGARVYEYSDNDVNFRVVVSDIKENSGGNSNLPSATEEIITFYSDRNLKERMKFKNSTLDYDKDYFIRNNVKESYLSTLYSFLHNTQKKKELGISDDLTYSYVFLDKDLSQGDFKIINNDIYLSSKDKDLKTLPKAFKELLESTETKDYKLDFIIKNASKKLKISPRKAKDLLEWHKNSSPITKDKEGLPKVFYHGSDAKDLQEFEVDRSSYGYFFSSIKDEAKSYQQNDGDLIQSFLKIKNPFKADEIHINSLQDLQKINDFLGLKLKVDENTFKSFALMKEYINEIKDRAKQYNLRISETDSANTTFIKGKKIINDDLTNPKNPIIKEAFKNFKHIGDRDVSHNLLGFVRNDFDLALFAMDRNRNYIGEYEGGIKKLKDILKQKGYDGIKFNEFQYSVFDSKQIKHIKNKGSYIDESGNITNTKPKDTQAEHRYFNEKSPNIFYSNSHLGTGLASGTLAGLETDENGNITGFDPQKFALGFLGGSAGSIAFKKGKDFLDKNPKYKEAIKKELADTLAQGFENASKKYPMLDMLKPIKLNIMQGEKARVAQANHILNKLEKDEAKLATIKEKTIKAVDRYAQTQAFKALSKDKQEAILSLKDIVPSPMPNDTPKGDLSKILKHFSSKQDKTQREFYAKLIDDTKANADITLEVTKQNTPRKEYIKAYQHKEDRDLYYIVITEDKDKINVTAFPTTQVNKIVSDIAKSMKVSGGSLGDTTNRQADKSPSPKLAR